MSSAGSVWALPEKRHFHGQAFTRESPGGADEKPHPVTTQETLRQVTDDWTCEQIAQAWTQCPTTERYVLELLFTSPCLPDEDDE